MGRKKSAAGEAGAGSSKKPRTAAAAAAAARPQQQSLAAGFAAQAVRASTDVVLTQDLHHDQMDRRLTDEMGSKAEAYLTAWAAKCHAGLREDAAAAARTASGGGLRARRAAAAASFSKEDGDLDEAALRYLDIFRHLQQQAFKQSAAFDQRHLEMLVLILRSDVVHSLGDVSYQAYSLLTGYLQRYPYASLAHHVGGQFAGRPYLVVDEQAAWQPLAAAANVKGLTRQAYIFEEAIKDAGHNYHLDQSSSSVTANRALKKTEGLMSSTLELLTLCFDRAVDSVEEDHNGDVLLLRYLLHLLHQDLHARLTVFGSYADAENEAVQRKRRGLLQNSLLWRVWTDDAGGDGPRQNLVVLLMKLIVGVASEQELQEVEEGQHSLDKDEEQASPCIATPRELAALAACFLNMLLDLMGTAEAVGGFAMAGSNRMHRKNQRLLLDLWLLERFWTKPAIAVCTTTDSSRTFLAALAPEHRLRLLSLVAMDRISGAWTVDEPECKRTPALARAKDLCEKLKHGESDFQGSFPADPVLALQCLNHKTSVAGKTFSILCSRSAVDNLAVVACNIALAAHSLVAAGAELPIGSAGDGQGQKGGGSAAEGRQALRAQLQTFFRYLAEKRKDLTPGSLCDLMHAQAALAHL